MNMLFVLYKIITSYYIIYVFIGKDLITKFQFICIDSRLVVVVLFLGSLFMLILKIFYL